MSESNYPAFRELEQKLGKTNLKWHPSEVHGLLCGMLNQENHQKSWKLLILKEEKNLKDLSFLLDLLYSASVKQLKDFLFEFHLLLPEDTDSLQDRAEALTLWCQGYLTAVHAYQSEISGDFSAEVRESLVDIAEIAKMNYEKVVPSEEDEIAYVELVEYVRMAVITIYEEIRGISPASELNAVNDCLH